MTMIMIMIMITALCYEVVESSNGDLAYYYQYQYVCYPYCYHYYYYHCCFFVTMLRGRGGQRRERGGAEPGEGRLNE